MPAIDYHSGSSDVALGAMNNAEAVTTSDTAELARVTRALYVGGAGNIAVVMADRTTVTFAGVPAGTVLPIRVRQVRATGTTATNLVGLD